ncbi:hypothetical protein EV702DRAFT_1200228 [Suillus placidus]|uniref:BTB domain-containing protein n=1 Tax=Suillus placidus TaxID=48579 RepID=A0A9P7D068_9AGAM|nr:hypothetical protein EV702DRAFT_1200228 [Suillus placidus]
MSDRQALVEALLMKSILGQDLVDTKFHLFSGRSAHSRKVSRLQALSANDVVLTARSDFFAELLSRTGSPDATFVDLDNGSAFEDDMAFDDYGYASDSDLEDEEDEKASQTPVSDETAATEGNTSESDDDDDDLLVVADGSDPIPASPPQAVTSITSAPIQYKLPVANCRNILVRDTAFRTWKALLLYLYTNKIVFSPLKSQGQPRSHAEGPNPSTLWPCSPKSMYRLGCKVRLDSVRDQAFNAIRNSLDAGNILQELASSFTSKYPEILQMHVQVLLQHITSVPVIQNMPSLVRRIVDSQLPHGADIIIDLYQKFLLQYHPRALALANAPANAPTEGEPASPQSDGELRNCGFGMPHISPQPAPCREMPTFGMPHTSPQPAPCREMHVFGMPHTSPFREMPRNSSPPSPRRQVPCSSSQKGSSKGMKSKKK